MTAVLIERLLQWSPFDVVVWPDELDVPVTRGEVACAIHERRFWADPYGQAQTPWTRTHHIERIAYLVVWPDPKPIEVDVGIPCLGYHVDWPILDGHHRLAAAIYRGDVVIDVSIGGDIDYAEELFGIKIETPGVEG